jgi:c-di-GMP-binding flagellar brake protein YcgR
MDTNRRKRTRVPVHFDVTVTVNGQPVKVSTTNISLTGILCSSDPLIQEGASCEITLVLNEDARIHIPSAKVIRTDPTETAITFTSLTEDGFYHLHRLLQFNAEDADLIDQELRQPAFD